MPNYRGVPIQILWGESLEKTITCATPLDAANAYPLPREGSEWVQASSGVEDAWITGTDEYLRGIVRWIPRADTPMPDGRVVTGWDGPNGWRAFLKWARGKNAFRVVRDWPNLLRNPGFEEGAFGSAPNWGVNPSRNLLRPNAAMTWEHSGGTALDLLGAASGTALSSLTIEAGARMSASCSVIADADCIAEWGLIWFDAAGVEITRNTAQSSATTWTLSTRANLQVPTTATSARLFMRRVGGIGVVRFTQFMLNHGSTLLPYEAPSAVVYDPEGAHSGARYLETYAAPGAANRINQTETAASGARAYYPVQLGDVVTFGGWVLRISGDGNARIEIVALNASKEDSAFVNAGNVAVPAWTYTERTYVVPEGKAYFYLSCLIPTGNNTTGTTARFDNVYLKIAPAGDAPLDMYLVDPMTGEPDLERDYTRRVELVMRTVDGSPVEGY